MQPKSPEQQLNRLRLETSPYLLQHAGNPVDWHAWGDDALAAARDSGKPILLSIGYSACHWCHVMAHESFEDPATAALMNELFVNIKVDREERPDLDKIYQIAQQMITQRPGGWPLTMFLTPGNQQPFFGGTYFPKEARHGMPAFTDVLRRVAEYFHANRESIRGHKGQIDAAFSRLTPSPAAPGLELDDSPLAGLRAALAKNFDATWGGFGGAPKFPHPASIEFCLRAWHRDSADLDALFMASLTLTRMAEGGIYDQLGGGFCRYSVDDHWMIPHFEKMLYDNGPLLAIYSQAAVATGETLFARVARETADWILRDMRSATGGFYCALDADSEGHEGKFYVWDPERIRRLTSPAEFQALGTRFGLNRPPNFEGAWHLHAVEPAATEEMRALIDSGRLKLLRERETRIRPARDDKILTAWNALTIKGLAIAARSFERPDFEQAASMAVDFIRDNLWQGGRLLAAWKDGRARFSGYLDDYAFLADALLALLQTRWRSADLIFLRELIDVMLAQFEDPVAHGFFFTAHDHESLIHRVKSFADEAIPAGNGIAASVLCRSAYLLGEPRYLDAAERTLRAAWNAVQQYPQGHVSLINALEDFLQPIQIVIVRGPAERARAWTRRIDKLYAPRRMCFAIPEDAPGLPDGLAVKRALGPTTAYLCTNMTCSAPINDSNELLQVLQRSGA
jgi:uncharacterized protein